jgi:hypothetical protein
VDVIWLKQVRDLLQLMPEIIYEQLRLVTVPDDDDPDGQLGAEVEQGNFLLHVTVWLEKQPSVSADFSLSTAQLPPPPRRGASERPSGVS